MADKTAPAKKDTSLKTCRCSIFEVGTEIEVDGQPDRTIETTGCDRQTNNAFAQGHDAKAVSFLVRAHLAGKTIWKSDGGVLITFAGPVEAARSISAPLAAKAEKMLATAAKKADAKTARATEKANQQAANAGQEQRPAEGEPAPETRPAPRRRSRAKTTA